MRLARRTSATTEKAAGDWFALFPTARCQFRSQTPAATAKIPTRHIPQTPSSRGWQPVTPRPRLYGGSVDPAGNSVQALDEAVLNRLRRAITAEAGGAEEQLNGVLRMLGAEIPAATQVPLFGQGPAGQAPKP